MFLIPRPPRRNGWIAATAVVGLSCGSAFSQNFSMQVANSDPLGLGSFIPSGPVLGLDLEGSIKGDLDYGLELDTVYNSNFFLTETNEESELSFFLTPWFRYFSDPEGGANFSVTANYDPIIRTYTDNSDLNDIDQSGDITFKFRGGKTEISVFGRYDELTGTDRLTGSFVDGSLFTGGFRAVRQIASRTSLIGGWSAGISDYADGANEGAEVYTGYFGAMWAASPRLSVGPTLRYTVSESDNIGSRDAWALLFDARYRVGEKIWLEASLGPEFAQTSGATSDEDSLGITGNFTTRYLINSRWAWTNTIRSATVPAPSETNYLVNDISLTSALHRQYVRGILSGGIEYSFSEYEDVGAVAIARSNENTFGVFMQYRRPLFTDRVAFDGLIRYSFNEGLVDWDQLFVSAGFNVSF